MQFRKWIGFSVVQLMSLSNILTMKLSFPDINIPHNSQLISTTCRALFSLVTKTPGSRSHLVLGSIKTSYTDSFSCIVNRSHRRSQMNQLSPSLHHFFPFLPNMATMKPTSLISIYIVISVSIFASHLPWSYTSFFNRLSGFLTLRFPHTRGVLLSHWFLTFPSSVSHIWLLKRSHLVSIAC